MRKPFTIRYSLFAICLLFAIRYSLFAQQLIDLNTASHQELTSVEGITETIARNIIFYRTATPFKIVDDLKKVEGITENLFLLARERFFVSVVGEDIEIYDDVGEIADEEGAASPIDAAGGADGTSVLEDLRKTPLDLNIASRTDFLDLPGITFALAEAIIAYRRTQPFKSVDDLKKILAITPEIYATILPYIRVMRVEEREFFAGDTRVRVGPSISPSKPDANNEYTVEPFNNPVQLYNRTRLRFGLRYEAGYIIDAGRWEPSINFQTLRDLHLKKFYVRVNESFGFDKVVMGNYQLQFAQGLVFYYPYGELVRPIKVKPRGVKVDTGTNPNTYFRGVAVEKKLSAFDFAGFYSYKGLYADLNDDGTARFDLESDAKNDLGDNKMYSARDPYRNINRKDNLHEELLGARVQWNFAPGTHISVIGYDATYSPHINHKSWDGSKYVLRNIYKFRGNRNTIVGGDFETWFKGINIFGEYARSFEQGKEKLNLPAPFNKERSGDAWLLQSMYNFKKFTFWVAYWDYAPDYYNPHSSAQGGRTMRDKDYNQVGTYLGLLLKERKIESQISYKPVKYKIPQDAKNYPGQSNDFWFDIKYKPQKEYEIYYRAWHHWWDDSHKITSMDGTTSETTDILRGYIRNRYQITYKPIKALRLKVRFDDSRKLVPSQNYEEFGWLSYVDVDYGLTSDLKLSFRYMFFDSPFFAMSSIDNMWPGVLVPFFWTQGEGKGRRWYLALSQKLDRNTSIWLRYENLFYLKDGYDRHTFKAQFDYKWGAAPRRARRREREDALDER